MPLPQLILDDRSYQQLRDELIHRIPVYAHEWDDHNPSDPGITLIELFAFLGENLLYRFNQIPDATRLQFLRLLQIPLMPANAASGLVTLSPAKPVVELMPKSAELRAGNLRFEAHAEVRVLPVSCVAVSKQDTPRPDANDDAERELSDSVDQVLTTLRMANPKFENAEPRYYQAVSTSQDASGPPVDFENSVDRMMWIAVLAEGDRDEVRNALVNADPAGVTLSLGFVPDPDPVVPANKLSPCPGLQGGDKGPAVEWQISTGQFRNDQRTQPIYTRLPLRGDGTAGLTRQGVVRLELPQKLEGTGVFNLGDEIELRGTGDLPPELDDKTEQRILFWIRAFRHDRIDFGRVIYVGANCVDVSQWTRAGLEFLGVGNGQPHQSFRLVNRPVIPGSVELQVESSRDKWESWLEVDSFHASRESDHCYTVDRESGVVRFGNGLRGTVPQIGQRIRVRGYRYGGGVAGNVAAGAITKVVGHEQIKGKNILPARGGTETESIPQALERIPGEFRRHDRAVTESDFRELAQMTPGADVGRSECLPRFEPRTRATEAAGVVTVMVWPRHDAKHPNAPMPDRDLLRRVCRYLDERRLVTTELYVVPPSYRKIAVSVGISVKPGYGIDGVRLWVELVIRQYLAPLPPYGPEGKGWPLGRRVHGPELEAAALQVEGVQFLEGLEVAGWNQETQSWEPGTVLLKLDEVPELDRITVVEGQPLPAGEPLEPEPVPEAIVPVPLVREEC